MTRPSGSFQGAAGVTSALWPTPRRFARRAARIVIIAAAALCGIAIGQTGGRGTPPPGAGAITAAPGANASSAFAHISYRPFIDPIDLHQHWYLLLIPLAFGIAVVYKAVRLRSLEHYWRHVLVMTTQIVGGMACLAVASYVLVLVYAQFIAGRVGG